ncbi:hypothetical protein H8356DRAFT_966742 [Neocallimastix lanati (nom. inval.)]|nr:hypothetical protein H8356DRAFT_966742 [Neocallimastix sp. JGI-2020a]
MIYKKLIYYIIIFLPIIQHSISKDVYINNSSDFMNYFSKNDSEDTVTIRINNEVEISNSDEVIILENKISKLVFQGMSKEVSSLNLSNVPNGIIFSSSIEKVEFLNIRIDANSNENCIMIENSDTLFYKSNLYGDPSCTRIVNYYGNNKSKISINETIVSGKGVNSLFHISKGTIESVLSIYMNFFSVDKPGGAFYIEDSDYSNFYNCTFHHGYSKDRGAGTLFYVSSDPGFVTELTLNHITETDIVTKTKDGKGLIIFCNNRKL